MKNIFTWGGIISICVSTILYKLDFKISQEDKHPDWPIFKDVGRMDSFGCKTKGDIVIQAIEMCPLNKDSLFRILKIDSISITKRIRNERENSILYTPTNFPNLQVIDTSTYGNEFSWGSTFSGIWSNSPGSYSEYSYNYPIAFLHYQNSYIKIIIGSKVGFFKIIEHDLSGSAWFYQINYPKVESDTLFFLYRQEDLMDDHCKTLFYAYKDKS